MAIGDLTALPAALQNAIQQNMLAKEYLDALRSILAYSRESSKTVIPAHIGATYTYTQLGELPATRAPIDPADISGLDDGLSTDALADEQFGFKLSDYAKTFDIDLLAQRAMIKNYVLNVVARQGRQAARMREAVAKFKLMNAYAGGNTVVTSAGSATTTQCTVDDVTAFGLVMINGNWVNVSSGSGMQLQVADLTNTAITLQITGITPDSTSVTPETDNANLSSRKACGGVSGVLHYTSTGGTPATGDILQAANASLVIRPNGKTSTQGLAPGDLFNTMMVMQGKQQLHSRGVMPYDDGWFRCVMPPSSMTQLFADADFKQVATGQLNSPEFRYGKIVRYQGVEFIETTEALVRTKGAGANGAALAVAVNSPILLGKGALVRGDFQGLDEFVAEQQNNSAVHQFEMLDDIAFSIRSPLDRLGRLMTSSFEFIMDYCTPSDTTSTPQLVPTTDNAAYKKAILFEHAA
jgi:hypothetical protein